MKRHTILIWLIFLSAFANAQLPDTLSLKQCHDIAINNYPLSKQFSLLEEQNDIRLKGLNTNYLPQLAINGQATYQSEVTEVDVVIPDITIPGSGITITPQQPQVEPPPKDQYKITLDLQQSIYDGGITSKQKDIQNLDLEISKQSIEIELYKLKENINSVYFSIILLQESNNLLHVLKSQLNNKLEETESAVRNGVLLESERDILLAELLKLEQQITEVESSRMAAVNILSELMSEELDENTILEIPDPHIQSYAFNNTRPEFQLFNMQISKIESSKKLITSSWNPRLFGFGSLGYGKPGLNMLSNEFKEFYIVGAKLNWQLWNWNKNKRDKEVLDIQNEIIRTQQETFNKNVKVGAESKLSDIQKYEKLISKDLEIISIRERVANTASSQLDNGVITSTEYVSRLNEATQAKINMQSHKIQLVQAKINYLAATGGME